MESGALHGRKYVREWGEFFRDTGIVAEAVVNDFINRYKEKKYLKQSLSRLMDKGFISRRGSKFMLTAEGRRYFLANTKIKSRVRKWDGKWRLITFDVPGGYNPKRDQIRYLLQKFNFYLLQKSVWICPNFMTEEFWKLIVENDLDKYCKAMVVEFLEGDKDLKKYFKLD